MRTFAVFKFPLLLVELWVSNLVHFNYGYSQLASCHSVFSNCGFPNQWDPISNAMGTQFLITVL